MRVIEECKAREIWQKVNNLTWAVEGYLDMCGYWRDRVMALESGVKASQQLEDKQNEGSHLGNLGTTYANLGQVEKSIDYNKQALDISRKIGDRQNESNWLNN